MAKGTRGRRGIASRQCRPSPYPLTSNGRHKKNCSKRVKKDWEDATCSVCMECPHNAVLLLCSSHEKGCRPYMCGTSFRYSNCLDQYKNAYTKEKSTQSRPVHNSIESQTINPFSNQSVESCEATELACPLCRGEVKGWTVVEPAREHLNSKKRSCVQDNCAFVGTFKELRKHVRAEHPSAKPREVDPTLEQKWRRLEREREREDVMSTIRSSMPGAVFFGDYVIEGNRYGFDGEEGFDDDDDDDDVMDQNEGGVGVGIDRNLMSVFLFLQAFGSASSTNAVGSNNRGMRNSNSRLSAFDDYSDQETDNDGENENDGNNGTLLVDQLHNQGRVFLGRSGRRRRHREGNMGRR